MKKLLYILASAALLGACEQKTEVVAPVTAVATPDPANTGQKKRAPLKLSAAPTVAESTEAKIDSAATEAKTEATPNP